MDGFKSIFKQSRRASLLRQWALLAVLALGGWQMAQAQMTVKGTVTAAEDGSPLIGAAVSVKGTTKGASTDLDGNFAIEVPDANAVLVFQYLGYLTQEIVVGNQLTLNVALAEDVQGLEEVIVVGYGVQKKKDLTGSVTTISSKEFQVGNITSPEQLVAGKIAGVQITAGSGAPGSGSTIRIRGGSSLNASNDPLIVIDGVPVDNAGISGSASPLSMVNPNDIETFTVLKDASATAIYGSRASNGVIIITTKKGKRGDAMKLGFSTVLSVAVPANMVDVLTGDELRDVVNTTGDATVQGLLGNASTYWQEEIYQTAISSDNNLNLTGAYKNLPYRASVGYLAQNGVLKGGGMDRYSASLGARPSFMDDHLVMDVNLKATIQQNVFANQDAIGAAIVFDPTQPIRSGDAAFGGFFEWLDAGGNLNTLASRNPAGLLEAKSDESTVRRSIGNVQLDYRVHGVPGLKANLNLGYDVSSSEGTVKIPAEYAASFYAGGTNNTYSQDKTNKTLDFYLNYTKELPNNSSMDITAGYAYQDFVREGSSLNLNIAGDTIQAPPDYKAQNTLVSFFGRAYYNYAGKYLVTATLRRDGSSRFSPDTRWGLFPALALAWKVNEEGFLKNVNAVSDLKVRLGYGVTGQQDIGKDFPYLPLYTLSQGNAQYQFGDNFYNTYRPEGYDANIKWEETATYNAGLDYGFADGRVSGTIDFYLRKTKDLLAIIPVPAGSNLTNQIFTNVGNLENRGVEFTTNLELLRQDQTSVVLGFNLTYNKNEITNLTKVDDPSYPGILVGGISGGVGNNIQIHTVGYPRNSFFVYRQVYDESGKPIQGVYEDINGDGKVTPDDRYRYKQADPNIFLGTSLKVVYGAWNFSTVLRGSINNYMYNNVNSSHGTYANIVANSTNALNNIVPNALETEFTNYQYFSDYYIENASFLRMDNLSLSYALNNLLDNKLNLQLSFVMQNVFVITNYTGIDPEISGGIDNNFYLRPRTFSFGLNATF